MQRKQRLNHIVSAIVQSESLDVATLAERFAVSEATIRRDLELLEQQRLVRRTHGGATTHSAFIDLPLGFKTAENLQEKRRIAQHALQFLSGAHVVGMTGGTTTTEFARLMRDRSGLSVITSALNIASDLAASPDLKVYASGGEVRSSSRECVGPSAEAFFEAYNVDVVFLGVDGVDLAAGCTNYDPAGARVNAALRARAGTNIVLADATKISKVALARVCSISDIDVLVTDSRAPQSVVEQIRQQGCQVDVV